jgi:D-psicose/D-tagatose/L-ribulose 3-epimerase
MKLSRRQLLFSLASVTTVPALARIGQLTIGVCSRAENFPKAVHYGFDYLEPPVAEIATMSDPAFELFRRRVMAAPIRCDSFNLFIEDLCVVGHDVHTDQLRNYMEMSLSRCRQLGGSIVVWGSASSRNVPPGFSRHVAWRQIQSFLCLAGAVAPPKGIVVAIEPLRTQESNIINTGAEAMRLVQEVNHPNVRMIIDYYHMRPMNEDPDTVWTARKYIVHFHFANPHGRVWPRSLSVDSEYGRFFALVEKIDYRGGISIEAHRTFEKDTRASLKFLQEELA